MLSNINYTVIFLDLIFFNRLSTVRPPGSQVPLGSAAPA